MTRRLHFMQHRHAFPILAALGILASAGFARFLVWHLGWRFPDASAGGGHMLGDAESVQLYTLLGCTVLPIVCVIATLMLSTISAVAQGRGDGVSTDTLVSRLDG